MKSSVKRGQSHDPGVRKAREQALTNRGRRASKRDPRHHPRKVRTIGAHIASTGGKGLVAGWLADWQSDAPTTPTPPTLAPMQTVKRKTTAPPIVRFSTESRLYQPRSGRNS